HQQVAGIQPAGQLVHAAVADGPRIHTAHQQAAVVGRIRRRLGDALLGQVVVELGNEQGCRHKQPHSLDGGPAQRRASRLSSKVSRRLSKREVAKGKNTVTGPRRQTMSPGSRPKPRRPARIRTSPSRNSAPPMYMNRRPIWPKPDMILPPGHILPKGPGPGVRPPCSPPSRVLGGAVAQTFEKLPD